MTRAFLTSNVVKTAIILSIAFWFLEWLMPDATMAVFLSASLMFVSLAICIMYAPVVIEAIAWGKIDRVTQLCMGVVLSWMMVGILRLINIGFHVSGNQTWILVNNLTDYLGFLLLCGGAMHLTAPDTVSSKVPLKSWVTLGICLISGAVVAYYAYHNDHAIWAYIGKLLLEGQ